MSTKGSRNKPKKLPTMILKKNKLKAWFKSFISKLRKINGSK